MNFLRIKDALDSTQVAPVSVRGTVLSKSDISTYKNRDGSERSFFKVVIADEENQVPIRVYNKSLHQTLKEESTYAFVNCIKKTEADEPLWLIANSQVISWTSIAVPEKVRTTTATTPKSERQLEEALISSSTSTVKGKIVQTSPVKYVRNGELPLRHLGLKDCINGPTVPLSLFGSDAEQEYTIGDVITVTNVYKYRKANSLSTKPTSTVEFQPSDLLPFEVREEDKLALEFFTTTDEASVPFSVMGIKYAQVYESCSKPACKNKKMKNGFCPNCGCTEKGLYCSARVIVCRENSYSEHSLFYTELLRLMEIPPLATFDDNNTLHTYMSSKLPIQGRGTFAEDKLSVSSVKRKPTN